MAILPEAWHVNRPILPPFRKQISETAEFSCATHTVGTRGGPNDLRNLLWYHMLQVFGKVGNPLAQDLHISALNSSSITLKASRKELPA